MMKREKNTKTRITRKVDHSELQENVYYTTYV